MYNIFTSTLGTNAHCLYHTPGNNPGQSQLHTPFHLTLSTVGAVFSAALPCTLTPIIHSDFLIAGLAYTWICFRLCLDLYCKHFLMASQPPSCSASAGASSSSSPALDSAAHRSCSKCSRQMSSYPYDKHTLYIHCRDVLCPVDLRCRECSSWSTEMMQDYLQHRKSLVSQGKKNSSVATPTYSSPSVPPSATPPTPAVSVSVAPPSPTLTSVASDQCIKDYVHSVLASFLSRPAS